MLVVLLSPGGFRMAGAWWKWSWAHWAPASDKHSPAPGARRNQKSTATPQNSPVGPPLSVGTPLFQENKPLQGICDTKASASGSRLVHPQLEKTSVLRRRRCLNITYSTWTSTSFLGIELKTQTSLDWILALPLLRCGIHCPTDDVKDWDDLQSTQHSDGHGGKKPQTCLSWLIVNKSPSFCIRFGPWMSHRGWERSTWNAHPSPKGLLVINGGNGAFFLHDVAIDKLPLL